DPAASRDNSKMDPGFRRDDEQEPPHRCDTQEHTPSHRCDAQKHMPPGRCDAQAHAPCPRYAELHCLSNFSFLRGASSADELFARAAKLGYAALAITDECSLAGIVRALEASEQHGVALIV